MEELGSARDEIGMTLETKTGEAPARDPSWPMVAKPLPASHANLEQGDGF
jgi:hypothetical protein